MEGKMNQIETLIKMLESTNDKNTKAVILQSYIASNGPIPDLYAEHVKKALETTEPEKHHAKNNSSADI